MGTKSHILSEDFLTKQWRKGCCIMPYVAVTWTYMTLGALLRICVEGDKANTDLGIYVWNTYGIIRKNYGK